MKKHYKKILIISILILLAGIVFYKRTDIRYWWEQKRTPLPEEQSFAQIQENLEQLENIINEKTNSNQEGEEETEKENKESKDLPLETTEPSPEVVLPDSINLKVPFSSQAPYANWGMPYQEACEEAAIMLVYFYYQGYESLSNDRATQEINALVNYEIEHYGDYTHTNAEETAQLVKDFYGYKKVEVKYDFSIDDIKKEIAQGRPVVVPTAGRILDNPNYTAPGPIYHMITIKGYTTNEFITNDVGTRLGADYRYSQQHVMDSVHEWHDTDITLGRKAMIVIYPD
jgi:hypothetical protein